MIAMQPPDAAELIRLEYEELPELRLTFWQVRRLFDLADDLCQNALDMLVRSGFLTVSANGLYQRGWVH